MNFFYKGLERKVYRQHLIPLQAQSSSTQKHTTKDGHIKLAEETRSREVTRTARLDQTGVHPEQDLPAAVTTGCFSISKDGEKGLQGQPNSLWKTAHTSGARKSYGSIQQATGLRRLPYLNAIMR